jgi:hypothetical protein
VTILVRQVNGIQRTRRDETKFLLFVVDVAYKFNEIKTSYENQDQQA